MTIHLKQKYGLYFWSHFEKELNMVKKISRDFGNQISEKKSHPIKNYFFQYSTTEIKYKYSH